jgi:hypothetical protein
MYNKLITILIFLISFSALSGQNLGYAEALPKTWTESENVGIYTIDENNSFKLSALLKGRKLDSSKARFLTNETKFYSKKYFVFFNDDKVPLWQPIINERISVKTRNPEMIIYYPIDLVKLEFLKLMQKDISDRLKKMKKPKKEKLKRKLKI